MVPVRKYLQPMHQAGDETVLYDAYEKRWWAGPVANISELTESIYS